MDRNMIWKKSVLIGLGCTAAVCAYEPQPYEPVKNSAEQVRLKKAALSKLRAEWTQDDEAVAKVRGPWEKGRLKPEEAFTPFNDDGSWKKKLSRGEALSEKEYKAHKYYFSDLITLAGYCRFGAKSAQEKTRARSMVYRSLLWYFDNGYAPPPKYHETFSYHPENSLVAGKMLILGHVLFADIHADRVKNANVQKLYEYMVAYGRQYINGAPQIRGPNWSFRLDGCLFYVLFTDDPAVMDEYSYHWNKALTFNRWETETDGVHPDWSMMHHGDMNYWGMYGIAWTQRVLEYGGYFKGTPWAYKTRQLDFIANCMLEGIRWILYRGNCEYTSAPKRATFLLARTDGVAASFKKLVHELIELGGDQLTRKADLEKLAADLILPPWSVEGGKVDERPEFSGHRYFWMTEYQAHRRPDFAIYVRRCSQRIRPPENSSQDPGQWHLNYGTGYTPIMRRGDELRLSRLCWDFQHVPGTTVEQGCTVSSSKAGGRKRGLNLFSGGVDDGQYGCGAFDMQMVEYSKDESGSYTFINGAGALKGNFFFDDGMVALGQDIRRIAPGPGKILTTINNVIRQGDVIWSVDGAAPKTVRAGEPLEMQVAVRKTAWVFHDQVGYVVLGGSILVLSCGERPFNKELKKDKGFRQAVSSEYGKQAMQKNRFDMFRLWLDHGTDPKKQTYAYAVFPGCPPAELKTHAARLSKVVRQNSEGVHAVAKDGILYAVFSRPGTARFSNSVSISSKVSLIVMVRRKPTGEYEFHASNPEHVGLRRPYVPGDGKTVGTLYEKPVVIRVSGFGSIKQVEFRLPVERGREGASVRGKAK